MNRRRFMHVLAAGGATLTLAACDDMPESALAPWQGPAADVRDPRLRALSWALLAPNPHNLQSWKADIRTPGEILLRVDLDRLLPETDPPGRQVLIGCGGFLELLRMAAAAEGHRTEIELLPEGSYDVTRLDDRPFARVRFVADGLVPRDPLFAFVQRRHTQRAAYESRAPEAAQIAQLAAAAEAPGISLGFTAAPATVATINRMALEGYAVEFANPPTWQETARVMRIGAQEVAAEPSGIALVGTKIWWAAKLGLVDHDGMLDPKGRGPRQALDMSKAVFEAGTPAWAWLTSADNTRQTQIAAGRSYLRLHLEATRLGLAMHPNSQVLQEFPAMAALYAAFHREVGVTAPARVQMMARIGFAPEAERSPRRGVTSLLVT